MKPEVRRMSFNEKLQKLRKANGLSQEGLADLLDVTRQSVSKWESGTTYPEMDKLLSMCKIFKCSLDDLTNDDITEIKIEDKKKSSIYTFVDSVLDFINETYHFFQSLTKKELMSCIIVMGITAVVLLLFRILFLDVENFFCSLLDTTHNDLFNLGSHVISFIINCCYWGLFLIIFFYTFRVVYLENDKYKNSVVHKKETVEKERITEKIIVGEVSPRKLSKSMTKSLDTLFRFLEKIVMFFVKLCVCFIILPILFILFFLCAAFFISLFLLFKGVFYISVLMGIPFAILFLLTILEILVYIMTGRKSNEKRLMIAFIVSILGLGSSFGILILDISSISYIDEIPKQEKMDTLVKNYDMKDNLYFLFSHSAEYIVDNTLGDSVKVEVDYYKNYTNIVLPPEVNSSIPYYERSYVFINQHLLSILIDDLSHRKIHNYERLNDVKIRIYATEENVQILKDNYQKEEAEFQKRQEESESDRNYYMGEIERYQNRITELEEEKSTLDFNNQELEQKVSELQTELDEYKRKVDKLQEIITE